ncbi:MAG: alpha/beta hydrolase [Hyphomicrobiaceae bacterium]
MRALATLALALALVVAANAPASAQARGQGCPRSFDMPVRFGLAARPFTVHLHCPATWRSDGRVLFVMHGRQRNAATYRDQWIAEADRHTLLIVVPEFDQASFPGVAAYNWGSVVDDAGKPRPPEAWAFGIIDAVFAEVRRLTGASRETYSLYGHSAGAQFAHRFLLLARTTKAELIVTANAGSYTVPVRTIGFPFGLDGVAVTEPDLDRAFARSVVVLLGEADNDPAHSSLPRQPGAQAQGPHRLARGRHFFEAARSQAAARGVAFNWTLVTVPAVGHDNAGMAARAAALVAAAGR